MLICPVGHTTGRVTLPTWQHELEHAVLIQIMELRQQLLAWMPNEQDRAQLVSFGTERQKEGR